MLVYSEESSGSNGSETFWNSHGYIHTLSMFDTFFLCSFTIFCDSIEWILCFSKGGVVIVYERKVKMLYGKFLDRLFFMIN
jgi:hypothetical protein